VTVASVMPDRRSRGWPRHEQGESVYVRELGHILARTYRTDGHFVQYATPNGRRLTMDALDHLEVEIGCIAFDIDCSAVHGSPEPAPETWRVELIEQVRALAAVHGEPFLYMTRGGGRIVCRLPSPVWLRANEDAKRWAQDYAITVAYLDRCFGLQCDAACADWTRLFRCPRATREPGGGPERWPTYGDPYRIASLQIDASSEDMATARDRSKAFAAARVLDFTPCSADGYGLLYHALRARGSLRHARGSNAFVIRCPNEAQHSVGSTADGSTLLYLPARGEELGMVHCKHAHCSGLRVRDWLRLFSETELDVARQAAGIRRTG
jgi:hypothetical protein